MMDTATDPGRRQTVDVRCDRINNNAENGCGWTGATVQITQYGSTSLRTEHCPCCDAPLVPLEER